MVSTKSHRILEGYRKHRQRHVGPFIVEEKIHDNAYRLSGLPPGMPTTQNVEHLMLFKPTPPKFRSGRPMSANIPDYIDSEAEWEVQRILDERGTRRNKSFLVKWANSPQKQWLPLRSLNHCCQLIRDYYGQNNKVIPDMVKQFLEENEIEGASDISFDRSGSDSSEEEQVAPDQPSSATDANSDAENQ